MTSDAAPLRTLVTGGTRGIGAAVVRRLARAGRGDGAPHEVVAVGRVARREPPSWLDALGEDASVVRFAHAEAADAADVARAFAEANADGRGLTGLVVSAGTWVPTPIEDEPERVAEAFRRVLEINVLGVVHAVTELLRHQRPDADCSIVLVGSTAGQRGEAGYSAYAASKSALSGLAKSWAVELAARRVRVNVVAPGWVDTEMIAGVMGDAELREEIERGIPRGRVATAEEVAGPIAFLLGPDAAHVTGSVLSVNGGGVLASA